MSQIQIRDEQGQAVPRINIRIIEGRKDDPAVDDATFDYDTDLAGNKGWPIPHWPVRDYTLHINAADVNSKYETTWVYVPQPPSGNYDDVQIILRARLRPQPSLPLTRLITNGSVFRMPPDNTVWRWMGCDAFVLPIRHAIGEDIDPYLNYVEEEGFNLLRCFVAMSIVPPKVGLPSYVLKPDQLAAFLDVLAVRHLRCELTVGDMQILMPDFSAQHSFYRELADVVRQYPGALIETCNEPFKNGVDVKRIGHLGVSPQASGDYGFDEQSALLDFITVHPERKAEWPRTAKDGYEFYEKWHRPVVLDEGVGAGEELIPWSRSNVPADFFDYAAVAALYSVGATFHFTDGVYARLPSPVQRACAKQFVAGLRSIALDATLGNYTRGYLANCPLEHDDATALRTFGRIMGNRAEVVVVRPTKHQPEDRIARAGWRIIGIEGDRANVVHLER